ncbi:Hypothetical predicted protein [Olea europaea subsp. europaea]|uniref:Secreted protein n=1 Tax=Olea europaea subsp. europaea TaxID=158383 RepID=A0A8S0U2A8_OLEEU|nr:Hypothetical predicted protein [Olea europaea subsp. europaea]
MSKVRQGRRLIFSHLWAVLGHYVQAMSGTRPVADATGTLPNFHVFLRIFLDTVCRQCSGRVRATPGMQPDFQAFVGSFWDTVCRPCPGCGRDAA